MSVRDRYREALDLSQKMRAQQEGLMRQWQRAYEEGTPREAWREEPRGEHADGEGQAPPPSSQAGSPPAAAPAARIASGLFEKPISSTPPRSPLQAVYDAYESADRQWSMRDLAEHGPKFEKPITTSPKSPLQAVYESADRRLLDLERDLFTTK